MIRTRHLRACSRRSVRRYVIPRISFQNAELDHEDASVPLRMTSPQKVHHDQIGRASMVRRAYESAAAWLRIDHRLDPRISKGFPSVGDISRLGNYPWAISSSSVSEIARQDRKGKTRSTFNGTFAASVLRFEMRLAEEFCDLARLRGINYSLFTFIIHVRFSHDTLCRRTCAPRNVRSIRLI